MTPAIIFYVVILGLTAVAIYVQVTASNLSLPIPNATSICVILLPWLLAATNFCNRLVTANKRARQNDNAMVQRLTRVTILLLQMFQGILTVVLMTLLSQTMTSSQILSCGLEGSWQGMWSAHDRRGIERIQDAFDCCGFNSVKDRAWPRDTCTLLYGRNSPCRKPWDAALRHASGLDFGVCLVVGLIQLYQLSKSIVSQNDMWTGHPQRREYKQLPQPIDCEDAGEGSRLIEDASGDNEDGGVEVQEAAAAANRRVVDEDREAETVQPRNTSQGTQAGYGTLSDGRSSVVVPSGLGNEANEWR